MREFIVLAKHKNYHAAAGELGISQPTLTNHIKKMEEELGITLFNRSTRSMELSELGVIFYPYAIGLTEMLNNAAQAIQQKSGDAKLTLTMVIEPQYDIDSLLQIFTRYQTEHPHTVLEFINASGEHALSLLRSGRCDLAILPQATRRNTEFHTITLREEYAVALLHKDYPLADRDYLTVEDLIGEKLFIPPVRLVLYKLLESACRDAGFELDPSCMGVTELMGMVLVKQNLGVMVMSNYAANKYADESLRLVEIRPRLNWYVNLLYANIHYYPEAKNLLDYVRLSLEDGAEPPHSEAEV